MHSNGRSGFGGFVLGLLFGPLGYIMALLHKPNQLELDNRSIDVGNKKRCIYCKSVVWNNAVKCPYCCSNIPLENKEN
jgi:hypothetical protein